MCCPDLTNTKKVQHDFDECDKMARGDYVEALCPFKRKKINDAQDLVAKIEEMAANHLGALEKVRLSPPVCSTCSTPAPLSNKVASLLTPSQAEQHNISLQEYNRRLHAHIEKTKHKTQIFGARHNELLQEAKEDQERFQRRTEKHGELLKEQIEDRDKWMWSLDEMKDVVDKW